LIFILLDRPDESHDRLISEHIMNSHSAGSSHPYTASSSGKRNRGAWEVEGPLTSAADTESFTLQQRLRWKIQEALRAARSADLRGVVEAGGVVSVELMRRYIEYAKQYVHPHLSPGAAKVLQRLYLTMRSEATAGQSIPVTTRHLESLIRLSQARARVDLREEVSRRTLAPDKCCRRNWMCYAMYSGAHSPHCFPERTCGDQSLCTSCEQVTAQDAQDVVQLLQESLLDVFTTDSGIIDAGRKGGISLAKQVKALVKVMTREAGVRGSNMFSRQDIGVLCQKLALDKEVDALIDVMRTECYLLLKGPRLYQLQTA
jgi:DNA helicase MCM8